MADQRKLDRWAEKLLDTGKRNNLINFRDTKASTAEILYPNSERVFSKCTVGHVFEIFDPKIPDMELELDEKTEETADDINEEKKLNREEYKEYYTPRLKSERYLLTYAQTPNPMTAIKNIAKKAQEMQDETGINVGYLAFGFLRWTEKQGSEVFYRAPLLLVHVNVITGSILDPIRIEISDDDVVVNPTFDYLLQAEYGISLPEYEDGNTLEVYFAKVSNIVRGLGWTILDECKLGIFSFLKINMYEDLKQNADKILENGNIKALLGENSPVSDITADDGKAAVVKNPLIDLHTVVDADSSQIEAIEMAKSGKSFVLQGPPGTGKSQTITNIIAECLHDGKKVLFVSEKQAALNVVFDKLKKAGLADFCLELHSHKANKKAVIEELNNTLELPKSYVSSNAQEEIRQKQDAQIKLDSYAKALHEKRGTIDRSLYQLFELYSSQRAFPDVKFTIKNIQAKGQDYLLQAVRLLDQYAEYTSSVGLNYKENPWFGFTKKQLSYEERELLRSNLVTLLQGFQNLYKTTSEIKVKYEAPDLNYTDTKKWQSLLAFSAGSDVVTPALLSREAYNYACPFFSAMKNCSEIAVPIRDNLLTAYKPEILVEIDGKDLYTKLTGQYSSFITRTFSGEYKNTVAGLQLYSKDTGKIKYQQVIELAEQLMRFQSAANTFHANELSVAGYLGRCYNGIDTDWDHVANALDTLKGYLFDDSLSLGAIPKMSLTQFSEKQNVFQEDSDKLSLELNAVEVAKAHIMSVFTPETLNLERDSYSYCIRKIEGCVKDFDKLGNWISFMNLLDQMENAELVSFVDTVIETALEPERISGAYRKIFYRQWIENLIFSVPELAAFSRIKQDQTVQSFVDKDNLQYEISKLQIRSELSQKRPNLEMIAGGSAVAILRREGHKKRKQMPIRRLLSETGSLVQILKPCFLMSPLSVSTFLDPDKISFDTVVFDEASQIFPQDAVGAIYRGKQLIVVGDSRQMPPSNFFTAAIGIDDDEDVDDITDFESVLDVCSAVFTTERLSWHYRSHYEQLIAFSNLNYYNNQLITFPSAVKDHTGIGVDYYYVEGIFDRKSKTNRAEAEFIVDLVYQNIEKYPDRSLGVVAFSVAQQNLIDNLLSKKREADQKYEWFFSADNAEPFFVKNLETVQGDERDTIIFSIAYAKDAQGRFIQNFGPLNRLGGERRLNVAVTRAKENVQLVSSIHYTDINTSTTESEGVKLLRAYLDYAQNGEKALERIITVPAVDQYDSYFEEEVCDFLRDNGYTVDTQVGCSGYRIDLGLLKPNSSNYLLAIECDGATYHNSKNARDRDSLRQRVLESMGWRFYRIWSTDWYRNNSIEKEKLLAAAKEAVEIDQLSKGVSRQRKSTSSKAVSLSEEVIDRFVTEDISSQIVFPEYHQVDALDIVRGHYNFLDAVQEILETEAPLSEEYLLKRIIVFFGREKITKVVLEDYERYMQGCKKKGIVRYNGFLYLQGMKRPQLRIPGDRREIKYISLEELAEGLKTLIEQNVMATKEGVYKTMTNLLGFNRSGDAIVSRYDKALQQLKSRGLVKEEAGVLSIASKGDIGKTDQSPKNTVERKPSREEPVTIRRPEAQKTISKSTQANSEISVQNTDEIDHAIIDEQKYTNDQEISRKEVFRRSGSKDSRNSASYTIDKAGIDNKSNALNRVREYCKNKDKSKEEIYHFLGPNGYARFTEEEVEYAIEHLTGGDFRQYCLNRVREYCKNKDKSKDEIYHFLGPNGYAAFTEEEVEFAIEHLTGGDFRQYCLNRAREYCENQDKSKKEMLFFLGPKGFAKFTEEEVEYAIEHLTGGDFRQYCLNRTREYCEGRNRSKDEIYHFLGPNGYAMFTEEEVRYAIDHLK